MTDKEPWVKVLIGAPGSGKSTWIKNNVGDIDDNVVIISSDDLLEKWGKVRGLTYSEAFNHAEFRFKDIETEMFSILDNAVANKNNLVIDRTNMSKKSRNRILSHVSKDYTRIAIVFNVDRKELDRRLAQRVGKHIPKNVVDGMLKSYEEPSEFSKVINV